MIRPLVGYVVSPDAADRVVAPVAEHLSPTEREEILAANPDTSLFLLTEAASGRARARRYLQRVIEDGTFQPTSGYWVYRISEGGHSQVGVVAEVAVAAYETELIRRHEHTVAEVADHLADALEEVGGSTYPVSLMYRSDPAIDELIAAITEAPPWIRVAAGERIQEAWDAGGDRRLPAALERIRALYIADGHHRSAGAAALARRALGAPHDTRSHFLAVLFPDSQMQTLSYHRCLHLPHHEPSDVLAAIARQFPIRPLEEPGAAPDPGEVWVSCEGAWYTLRLPHGPEEGPVSALDAARLQHRILGPICDVADPRTDPRLNYVPGNVALPTLAADCEAKAGLSFVTRPPSVSDVMAVSDAGGVMPPKSTWFTPKVGAGLFLRTLDA